MAKTHGKKSNDQHVNVSDNMQLETLDYYKAYAAVCKCTESLSQNLNISDASTRVDRKLATSITGFSDNAKPNYDASVNIKTLSDKLDDFMKTTHYISDTSQHTEHTLIAKTLDLYYNMQAHNIEHDTMLKYKSFDFLHNFTNTNNALKETVMSNNIGKDARLTFAFAKLYETFAKTEFSNSKDRMSVANFISQGMTQYKANLGIIHPDKPNIVSKKEHEAWVSSVWTDACNILSGNISQDNIDSIYEKSLKLANKTYTGSKRTIFCDMYDKFHVNASDQKSCDVIDQKSDESELDVEKG